MISGFFESGALHMVILLVLVVWLSYYSQLPENWRKKSFGQRWGKHIVSFYLLFWATMLIASAYHKLAEWAGILIGVIFYGLLFWVGSTFYSDEEKTEREILIRAVGLGTIGVMVGACEWLEMNAPPVIGILVFALAFVYKLLAAEIPEEMLEEAERTPVPAVETRAESMTTGGNPSKAEVDAETMPGANPEHSEGPSA